MLPEALEVGENSIEFEKVRGSRDSVFLKSLLRPILRGLAET